MEKNEELYSKIFTILKRQPENGVEFASFISNSVDEDIYKKVVSTLEELDQLNDAYAPMHLALIKSNNDYEEFSSDDKLSLLKKSVDRGSEYALYEYFDCLLCSVEYDAPLDEQKKLFKKVTSIDLKYLDRAIESSETKAVYKKEGWIIHLFIDFFRSYKNYLAIKNSKELTIDLAKAFADIADYDHAKFYDRFIQKIPEMKELYISTAKWLVEQGIYDPLVYLVDFEPECQMTGSSYTTSLWNKNRKKPLLNRAAFVYPGCQKGSTLCCLRYIGYIEQAFPYYSKRSERDRKRDVEVYLKLNDYYKKQSENGSYEETIYYLNHLLRDVATYNDVADYNEFHRVLMENLNNNREDL